MLVGEMATSEIIAEIERLLPGMSEGELARLLVTLRGKENPERAWEDASDDPRAVYARVRGVPASRLEEITGIISLGGDAVEDCDRID